MERVDSTLESSKRVDDFPRLSDVANWARPVDRLVGGATPDGAINLNVDGRHLTSPIQGFGRMWHKRHRISLGAELAPDDVIGVWKSHFGDFWPRGNYFYGPITALEPGDVAVLNLDMPGGTRLSTGVMVLYADAESFTLMTPEGHLFAGWITFSSFVENGITVAQAEILMRASDPVFEIGMELMGHRRENRFWEKTLMLLAAYFGINATAHTEVECIDNNYQWERALNVWQNSAIRTGLFQMTKPVRRGVNFARKSLDEHWSVDAR
jgi:hypothetical protein